VNSICMAHSPWSIDRAEARKADLSGFIDLLWSSFGEPVGLSEQAEHHRHGETDGKKEDDGFQTEAETSGARCQRSAHGMPSHC